MVERGSGAPVTLIAVGGPGAGQIGQLDFWGAGLAGTAVSFEYGTVAPWTGDRPPRREAERDAAEALAAARRTNATRAIGSSRGARALVGTLAEGFRGFERVALALPPGGTAAGRYREWLAALPPHASAPVGAPEILICAWRGESGHPVAVAEEWADRLGATLEVFPSLRRDPGTYDAMQDRIRSFMNSAGLTRAAG